jgi:hypothetical protein
VSDCNLYKNYTRLTKAKNFGFQNMEVKALHAAQVFESVDAYIGKDSVKFQ